MFTLQCGSSNSDSCSFEYLQASPVNILGNVELKTQVLGWVFALGEGVGCLDFKKLEVFC